MKLQKKLAICAKCRYGKDDGTGETFEGAPNSLVCEKNNNALIRGFADCESCPMGRW